MKLSGRRDANLFSPFRKPSQRSGVRGSLYRLVDRLAPVTRSAPVRRAVQYLALILFCYAFFVICWPYAASFDTTTFSDKAVYPVHLFLLVDPLVGLSTVLAGRFLNGATLLWTVGILLFCLLVPRAFCGYCCPLGTLIDLFDTVVGRCLRRWQIGPGEARGWWVHLKYYLLCVILVAALCGSMLAGFASAIPVLTRGLLLTGGRLQLASMKGSTQLFPLHGAMVASLLLFAAVFALSLLGPRFWCRYACPSGALLSVFNFLRVGQRQVEASCINCNRCLEICPFDAIQEDYLTRVHDCTYCQSCGGVCPTGSIKFVTRWNWQDLKQAGESAEPAEPARPVSRRAFVGTAIGTGAVVGLAGLLPASSDASASLPVRPPGSVPEPLFLDLCIRCGQCFKVCPGPVLDVAGLEFGFASLWTPVAKLDHAGCHQDCNFCTLVCPTGAIQPLPIEVKRKVHMGLAQLDPQRCLPLRRGSAGL